jgi:hypothetical protein
MSEVPKKEQVKQSVPYFGAAQEKAVVKFLKEKNQLKKSKIYNDHLKGPLNTMIESIIRRYKLYSKDMSFDELHSDTLSFLMTKFNKFDPKENKKAYSYFGTIVKHYLLGKIIKYEKDVRQFSSYEDLYQNIDENENYSYRIDNGGGNIEEFFREISNKIRTRLDNDKKMNENEVKVGEALLELLNNWESILDNNISGSTKFNKNRILSHIREYTLLSTKDIRVSMKKYKELYRFVKNDRLDKGLL